MIRIKGRVSRAAIAALEAGKLPPQSEDALQACIVAKLRASGFTVLVTSRRRKKCRKCGTYGHAGDGADKGTPDLLVSAAWMPAWLWVGMEIKKPGTIKWSSWNQKLLAERGMIHVVQSVEQALAAMGTVRNQCGIGSFAR